MTNPRPRQDVDTGPHLTVNEVRRRQAGGTQVLEFQQAHRSGGCGGSGGGRTPRLLAAGPKAQQELATTIGVTPSVVVDMLDELEELHALRRVRDTTDRRRQLIELTSAGQRLRRRALRLARETDQELLSGLDAEETATLRRVLGRIASANGIAAAG